MDKNSSSAFYRIYLNVRLMPGMRMVRVPLTAESTASEVVDKCKETLGLDADYSLAADFDGFEKQFGAQERLYHLVKKQVLWAGLDRRVQFFIRKKKKQTVAPLAGPRTNDSGKTNAKPVDVMIEREISTAECSSERRLLPNSNSPFPFNAADGRFSLTSACSLQGHAMAGFQGKEPVGESWMSNLSSMSYSDLIQFAEQQKRNIEANNGLAAAKETKLKLLRGQQQNDTESALASRLSQLRQQIKAEDVQLQQLRRLRAEVEEGRRRSVTARIDLQEARRLFADKERQLKEGGERVQDLLRQLDIVRRRRLIANKENELKRLDAALGLVANGKCDATNNGAASLESQISNPVVVSALPVSFLPQHQRPKAAVEPFKVVPPSQPTPSLRTDKVEIGFGGDNQYGPSLDYLHSKGFVAAFTAMEEVLQQTTDLRCSPATVTGRSTPLNALQAKPVGDRFISSDYAVVKREILPTDSAQVGTQLEQSADQVAPIGYPFDSHRDIQEPGLPQPVIPKINISINRRFQIANASRLLSEERPPPDLIPASEKTKFINYEAASTSGGMQAASPITATTGGATGGLRMSNPNGDSFHPRGEADKIHLRSDTLRAAKRRSWAENHLAATTDEAEHIRLLLSKAQQRGKSSLNLSWIFDQLTTSNVGQQFSYNHQRTASLCSAAPASGPSANSTSSDTQHPLDEEVIILPEPTEPPPPPPVALPPSSPSQDGGIHFRLGDPLPVKDSIELSHDPLMDYRAMQNERAEMFELGDDMNNDPMAAAAKRQRCLGSEATMYQSDDDEDEEDERSAVTVVEIVSSGFELKSPPSKGILRLKPKDDEERGRRIHFDTLALLLDAALEGELELVKSCASKLANVSICTEEGITALHNAICAGHYDIVRFLVEAGANVNAEDGDGWTPLHCAASCNNLPMVKFLIERGACIFATSTVDHETPADKCEKEEEGFDGCSRFLFTVQEKLGILNGGRVYAAYDYEAEYEDELTVKADEALLILRREDEKEKGWWWAKQEATGQEGYVPRNYLALYPRLAAQRAGAVINTVLPSSPESESPKKEESKLAMELSAEKLITEDALTVEP